MYICNRCMYVKSINIPYDFMKRCKGTIDGDCRTDAYEFKQVFSFKFFIYILLLYNSSYIDVQSSLYSWHLVMSFVDNNHLFFIVCTNKIQIKRVVWRYSHGQMSILAFTFLSTYSLSRNRFKLSPTLLVSYKH